MFKTGFLVQNHPLSLCSSAVNSQSLLCSQKAGVNVRIKALWYTNGIISQNSIQLIICFLVTPIIFLLTVVEFDEIQNIKLLLGSCYSLEVRKIII